MNRALVSGAAMLTALALGNASSMTSAPPLSPGAMSVASRLKLVDRYCAYCHDEDVEDGDFSFTEIDLAHPDRNAEQAEKVILKLRTGMMPPVGMPRPDDDSLMALAAALETDIDRVAAANPNPGRPALYRLNRTEYRNAIRDLLALDIDVESLLPADNITRGFDNMSEALTVTPTLMEGVRPDGREDRPSLLGRSGDGSHPGNIPCLEELFSNPSCRRHALRDARRDRPRP